MGSALRGHIEHLTRDQLDARFRTEQAERAHPLVLRDGEAVPLDRCGTLKRVLCASTATLIPLEPVRYSYGTEAV